MSNTTLNDLNKLNNPVGVETNGKKPSSNEDEWSVEAKKQLRSQFRERLYKAVALKNHVLSDKSIPSGMPQSESDPMSIAKRLNTLQCILAGTATSSSETPPLDKSSSKER